MKKLKISLMFKIMLLCVGLIVISSNAIRIFAYQSAKSTIEGTLGQMALNITGSVNASINTELYAELTTPEHMEKEYYKELRQEFVKIKKTNGLKYLYTMNQREDGVAYYCIDGSPEGDENQSLLGDVEEDISEKMQLAFEGSAGYELYESEEWGTLISGYIPIINASGEVLGMLGADFDAEFMVNELAKTNRDMLIIGLVIAVIASGIAFIASYYIVKSIKQLRTKVHQIKKGDLTIDVASTRTDEVGSLSRAFQEMIKNMSLMIQGIRDNAQLVGNDITSLNESIDISNKATEEITKIVSEIALGATRQVESVEEVESSMENVFSEIETIIGNISEVNKDSDHAMKDMQEATVKLTGTVSQINLVNNTVETTATVMKKLEEKFREVLSFSSSIEAIATKTNLLALNASIEAASAGVHGKGFAVVAGEIKNLAKQSSDASKHINALIAAVQEEINHSSDAIQSGVVQARDGVNVMAEVEVYLHNLSKSNQKIDGSIKEIAKAILNIEDDGKKVLEKTSLLSDISKELSEGTQQTAAETEEQYAIMEGLKNDLANVKDRMEQLDSLVNKFKIK
jgi:methyl-accepting chemotaxis protein